MKKVTPRATPNANAAIRRNLAELMERPGWVHHVADAATGKLLTTRLRRPVTPLSRAKQLSKLGHQFEPSIFGTATHRLTPRYPWQSSPLGFLRFTRAYEVDALRDGDDGNASWLVSEDIVGKIMDSWVFEVPQGRCLLTLYLGTVNAAGSPQVGRIRIEVGGYTEAGEYTVLASFRLAAHGDDFMLSTFDLVFMPAPASNRLHAVEMFLEPGSGLARVWFFLLTLAPQPPLDIGPPT